MRCESDSLDNYGVDLYPEGPASAYRTTAQQQELYDLYLSGQGAPANPPGTSSHETGTAVDVAEPAMRDVIDQIGTRVRMGGDDPVRVVARSAQPVTRPAGFEPAASTSGGWRSIH